VGSVTLPSARRRLVRVADVWAAQPAVAELDPQKTRGSGSISDSGLLPRTFPTLSTAIQRNFYANLPRLPTRSTIQHCGADHPVLGETICVPASLRILTKLSHVRIFKHFLFKLLRHVETDQMTARVSPSDKEFGIRRTCVSLSLCATRQCPQDTICLD
jgi:hypothetical protein